jgi:hypothetical protein
VDRTVCLVIDRVLSERLRGPQIAPELTRRILLREVNGRIRDISDRWGTPEGVYRLVCECGEEGCEERVDVPMGAYDELRRKHGFLLAAAHGDRADTAEKRSVIAPPFRPATSPPLQ